MIERFGGVTVPDAVRPHLNAFKGAHTRYEAACVRAEAAKEKRDEALSVVGIVDEGFDGTVNELADKMVGAGIGKRQNPFAGLSTYSPSKLTSLAYADEPKAARDLVGALSKKKPPAEVAKVAARLLKDASAVEAALKKLTAPQAAYSKALGDRDALLPDWDKSLRTLKKYSAAAWDGDDATFKALFAPVGAVQAPRKRRAAAAGPKAAKKGNGKPAEAPPA